MTFRRIATVLISIILATMTGSAIADGQGATRTLIPLNLTFANPCTGEMMQTHGSILMLTRSSIDGNGTMHGIFRQSMHDLKAVGLDTGIIYKAVGTNFSTKTVQTVDGTGTFMLASRFGYVSQGPTPNWFQIQRPQNLPENILNEDQNSNHAVQSLKTSIVVVSPPLMA